jgi:hypothetical protein
MGHYKTVFCLTVTLFLSISLFFYLSLSLSQSLFLSISLFSLAVSRSHSTRTRIERILNCESKRLGLVLPAHGTLPMHVKIKHTTMLSTQPHLEHVFARAINRNAQARIVEIAPVQLKKLYQQSPFCRASHISNPTCSPHHEPTHLNLEKPREHAGTGPKRLTIDVDAAAATEQTVSGTRTTSTQHKFLLGGS